MTTNIEETPDEVDELRHAKLMADAELELLRGPALRETIREAGFDPSSSSGRTLAELAKTDESLRTSSQMMRSKASELGLEAAPSAAVSPTTEQQPETSGLNDPAFGPDHPRNTPGDAAFKIAARQRRLIEHNNQLLANMRTADEHGRQEGELSAQERSAGRPPAPAPTNPGGTSRLKDDTRAAFIEKNRLLREAMSNR